MCLWDCVPVCSGVYVYVWEMYVVTIVLVFVDLWNI